MLRRAKKVRKRIEWVGLVVARIFVFFQKAHSLTSKLVCVVLVGHLRLADLFGQAKVTVGRLDHPLLQALNPVAHTVLADRQRFLQVGVQRVRNFLQVRGKFGRLLHRGVARTAVLIN